MGNLLNHINSIFGAGDEARTRDIQFGKLKLYQLSYTRVPAKPAPTGPFFIIKSSFGGGGWIRTSVL
jgi:hypothetical protein